MMWLSTHGTKRMPNGPDLGRDSRRCANRGLMNATIREQAPTEARRAAWRVGTAERESTSRACSSITTNAVAPNTRLILTGNPRTHAAVPGKPSMIMAAKIRSMMALASIPSVFVVSIMFVLEHKRELSGERPCGAAVNRLLDTFDKDASGVFGPCNKPGICLFVRFSAQRI